MQIESILIFIAFVVISSFANKRKEAQYKQRQQQKREVQATQARPQATQAKQQTPVKRTLQDLFREMQQEIETLAQPPTQQKVKPAATLTYENADPRIDAPSARSLKEKKPIKPSFVNKKSPVYKDEIKDQPVEVGFNMTEEAILNGIIFSEVIGKPKAMRG